MTRSLSRRAFALGLPTTALSLGGLPSVAGVTAASARANAVIPLAQISVGRFTVTALTDGYADMPFGYFPGRTAEQVEAAARAQFAARSTGIRFVFNQYLVEDGDRRILIDAGPAGSLGQTGQLSEGLAALGIRRDQIDAVIVTHMHQDHLGGLVAGGRRNFPNAEVYVDRRDVKHWTDPAKQAAAPHYLQNSFRLSGELVRLYPKLQAIDGEPEIVPGVSILDLTGHTPGHIGVRIEDAGRRLTMVSDMLFPVVHPGASESIFLFEQDRPAAQAMRARSFPRPADDGALIAATHMPFPGLERIVSESGGCAGFQPNGPCRMTLSNRMPPPTKLAA